MARHKQTTQASCFAGIRWPRSLREVEIPRRASAGRVDGGPDAVEHDDGAAWG